MTRNRRTPTNYSIPYHATVNPDKNTTKVRVVFDASAKIKQGQCSLYEYGTFSRLRVKVRYLPLQT